MNTVRALAAGSLTAGLVAAGTVLGPGAPARAAAPAHPSHVAIDVAGVGAACVPWHAGMTGADVLADRYDVETRMTSQGPMVVQIDGHPTQVDTAQRYWAYFHRTGAAWVYSQVGAASYQPAPGTVEGWSYTGADGSAKAPPATDYATICAGADASPASSTSRAAPAPPPPPAGATAGPGPTSSAAQPSAGARPAPGSRTSGRRAGTTPARAATPAVTGTTDPAAAQPPASPAAAALATAPPKARVSAASALPPWGTALGAIAVAALGGLTWWRVRRRQQP